MGTPTGAMALAVCGIVTVQAVFAGYQILGKLIISGGLNPIAFALVREISSSVVFVLAALCILPSTAWPRREHFLRFLVCGVSMFGNVFLNLVALTLTTPTMVTLLQPTQPVFAAILASVFGHETMSGIKALGVVFSCAGSLVMALAKNAGAGVDLGSLVVLAQCASGANYVVQQWPLMQAGYSPLIVSSCSYLVATALTIVVAAVYFAVLSPHERSEVTWWLPTPLFGAALAYVVLLTTVYNYVVMAWATGKLGASLVTLFMLLQGVFACIAEWLIFGELLVPLQAAGALAIFVGLCIVVMASRRLRANSTSYVDTRETWAAALRPAIGSRQNSCFSDPLTGHDQEAVSPERPPAETPAAAGGGVKGV